MTLMSPPGDSTSTSSYPIGGGPAPPGDQLNASALENVRMSPPPLRRSSIIPLTRQNAVSSANSDESDDDETRVQPPNGAERMGPLFADASPESPWLPLRLSGSSTVRVPQTRSMTRQQNRYGPLANSSTSSDESDQLIARPIAASPPGPTVIPRHTIYDYNNDLIAFQGTDDPMEGVSVRERIHHLRLGFVDVTMGRSLSEGREIGLRYQRILRELQAVTSVLSSSDTSSSDTSSSSSSDNDSDYTMESKQEEEELMRETKEEDTSDDIISMTYPSEDDDDEEHDPPQIPPRNEESDYVFQRMEDGSLPSAQPDLVPPPGV